MKYVITGGAGNISKPLTEALLQAGNDVVVIGRNAEKLKPLTDKGAVAAVGSLEDEAFVKEAFAGADAVYLMIPPNMAVENFRGYQNVVAKNYITAIKENQIKYVVVLSSIGAHRGTGVGPVDGLADLEKMLSELTDVNVKILRPSYFMANLLGMIPLIKNMQIMGANFAGGDEKLVLVHTDDIAAVAAEELLALNFIGHSVRYIASDEKTGNEIAEILSAAINKPGLPWITFTDEQTLESLQQAGFPAALSEAYTTMGKAIREGRMQEDYWKNHPQLGPTKLEDFAQEFAVIFNQQAR
jgi:uncharacterized protein YbjT (DUF2867 family)